MVPFENFGWQSWPCGALLQGKRKRANGYCFYYTLSSSRACTTNLTIIQWSTSPCFPFYRWKNWGPHGCPKSQISLSPWQPMVQSTFTCDPSLLSPLGVLGLLPPLRTRWVWVFNCRGFVDSWESRIKATCDCTLLRPRTVKKESACPYCHPTPRCEKMQSMKASETQSSCSQHVTAQNVSLIPRINR